MILVILLEFLKVVLPAGAYFGITGFLWWSKLNNEDKEELKSKWKKEEEKEKKYRRNVGGGWGGLVFFLSLIIIFIDGNWDTAIASLPFSYYVFVCFWVAFWAAIVFGIPFLIVIYWLSRKID